MPEIRTELEIEAPADTVWRALTDFPAYSDWNPFLVRVRGEPRVGAAVDLKVMSGPLPFFFHTRVLVADRERELRWRGHLLSDGVIAGEHYFLIEPLAGGRVRFIHGERFTGALASAAWTLMAPFTRRGYAAMNAAFKARAEAAAQGLHRTG